MTQIAHQLFDRFRSWRSSFGKRGAIESQALVVFLAALCGLLAGYGAVMFTHLIEFITTHTYGGAVDRMVHSPGWGVVVVVSPAIGILLVAAMTRRWAPAAQSHGVPEVICSVARHDGVIPPRVGLVKVIASGLTIGTGGAVGREGPIVQIGATLGSVFGQRFKLSARNIKLLVAAGAGAGISATFNAPLAGVVFASEIILGSFAVQTLTPIVIACVIADIVQRHNGEHGFAPAFQNLGYDFGGAWQQLPSFLLLGLIAGLVAVGFIRVLYGTEDVCRKYLPNWWQRAIAIGLLIGTIGLTYPNVPPHMSDARATHMQNEDQQPLPPLMGVGYGVVEHTLHLEAVRPATNPDLPQYTEDPQVKVTRSDMLQELWWILPLVLLKPLMTSLTLGGGGSGGVFAPSLYIGATLGACVGIVMNLLLPEHALSPGMYAIVGMGAVVAGTTHGVLSAILIVYEMTDQYEVILPIMAAAGLSSLVASMIEPESIYYKKLSRRGEIIARGHDLHSLDHIMVRDVMIRTFPVLKHTDNVLDIVRIARDNPEIESLPVNDDEGKLIGIIRAEDLHRVLDSDISPQLVNAEDIALRAPISVEPSENLIEALRDFGTRDVETLPVEVGKGANRRLVGLLLRSDVMSRYRQEMLSGH